MVMIIQENQADDRIDPQVPRAFELIKLGKGVVRILQGAPVQGEAAVTQEPAHEIEVEKVDRCDLNGRTQRNVEAGRHGRNAVQALKEGLGAGLATKAVVL